MISKQDAIRLIKTCRDARWQRTVEAIRLKPSAPPFAIQVILRKEKPKRWGADWAQIIVSFRRGRRMAISISTTTDYERNAKRGIWDAAYQLNRLADPGQREVVP